MPIGSCRRGNTTLLGVSQVTLFRSGLCRTTSFRKTSWFFIDSFIDSKYMVWHDKAKTTFTGDILYNTGRSFTCHTYRISGTLKVRKPLKL
jgi:hypothetical protein